VRDRNQQRLRHGLLRYLSQSPSSHLAVGSEPFHETDFVPSRIRHGIFDRDLHAGAVRRSVIPKGRSGEQHRSSAFGHAVQRACDRSALQPSGPIPGSLSAGTAVASPILSRRTFSSSHDRGNVAIDRQLRLSDGSRRRTKCHIVAVGTSFPKPGRGLVSTDASNAARRKPPRKSPAAP